MGFIFLLLFDKVSRPYAFIIGVTVMIQEFLRNSMIFYNYLTFKQTGTFLSYFNIANNFCLAMMTILLLWNTRYRWIGWIVLAIIATVTCGQIYEQPYYLLSIISKAAWGIICALISYKLLSKYKKLPYQIILPSYWIIIYLIIGVICKLFINLMNP